MRASLLSGLIVPAALCLVGIASASGQPRVPQAEPAEVNVDPDRLAVIDEIVAQGLRRDRMRGCVVLVGARGKIVHRKAYGQRVVEPEAAAQQMSVDTIFDLASLTKPIATATSVMLLVEDGSIDLDKPACTYLPEFTGDDKENITVRQLLTHQGGLIADNSLRDYLDGPEKAWERICNLDLVQPPGEKFIYSDVSFIVLGQLVQRVSGQPLNEFARQRIYQPLGMHDTGFLPPEKLKPRIAPTEKQGDEWLQGTVHDPRSREMGGVAGHAGLFSTADDLAIYAQMLIDGGRRGDVQILRPETIALMNTPHETTGGLRSLGWDRQSVYSSNRGDLMSEQAFGHGGFTGTAIWIDPPQELFVIFLSSRLHPDGEGSVNRLAGRIGTVAAAAILPPAILPR